MKQGDVVIYRGPSSNSNGHDEQPAIVNKVWGPAGVNITVLPDCGVPYCATSVEVVENAAAAEAKFAAGKESGVVPSLVWPA